MSKDFQWTPEKVADYFNHCEKTGNVVGHWMSFDTFKRKAEHTKPTISDEVVDAIVAFNVDDSNPLHFPKQSWESKRDWVEMWLSEESAKEYNNNVRIHTVRNKQGEEFSVDEDVDVLNVSDNCRISTFLIETSGESKLVAKVGDRLEDLYSTVPIEWLRKSKPKILLTTFDGVDITDGEQIVCGVWLDDDAIHLDKPRARLVQNFKGEWKWFSTIEARQAYIERNTKRFSIEDVENEAKEVLKDILSQVQLPEVKRLAIEDFTIDLIHALKSKTND